MYAHTTCAGETSLLGQKILTGLRLADSSVDYLDLRSGAVSVGHVGWRCAEAPDRMACERVFVSLKRVAGAPWAQAAQRTTSDYDSPLVLLVERDGAFTAYADEWEVHRLIGPIDTVEEAALVAWFRGYAPWCGSGGSTGQADGSGWVLTARSYDFPGSPFRGATDAGYEYVHRARVGRDGAFSFTPLAYVRGIP